MMTQTSGSAAQCTQTTNDIKVHCQRYFHIILFWTHALFEIQIISEELSYSLETLLLMTTAGPQWA